LVYTHTSTPISKIDLSSLPAGFYTIHISFQQKREIVKAWKLTK
jgi:hypothetical protein